MLERWMRSHVNSGLLILRCVVGFMMMQHGLSKISTLLGGEGFEATVLSFKLLGVFFPVVMVYLVGVGQILCGFCVIVGLFTREAGLCLFFVTLVSLYFNFFSSDVRFAFAALEMKVLLLAMFFSFFYIGAGGYSVDAILFPKHRWRFVKDPSSIRLDPPEDFTV